MRGPRGGRKSLVPHVLHVAGGKQGMQELKHVLLLPQPGRGQDIEDCGRPAEAQGWEEEK